MGVRVVFPDMGKDPSVQLIEKTITENGTYDAITDGANGYSKVNVNVEGGGESDFSTAEVTVINNSSVFYNMTSAFIEEGYIITSAGAPDNDSNRVTIVLYKGLSKMMIIDENEGFDPESAVTIEGDASYDGTEYTITGDCTITISAEGSKY